LAPCWLLDDNDLSNVRPAAKMRLLLALFALPSCAWAEFVVDQESLGEALGDAVKDLAVTEEPDKHDEESAPTDEADNDEESAPTDEAEDDEESTDEAESDEESTSTDEPSEGDAEEFTEDQFGKLIAQIDADTNGKVSVDEILQFSRKYDKSSAAKKSKDMMKQLDNNTDGTISRIEWLKDLLVVEKEMDREKFAISRAEEEGKFDAADANNDGKIDGKELEASHQHEHAAKTTLSDKDRDHDELLTVKEFLSDEADDADGKEPTYDEDDLKMFKDLDKDGNGKLDLKELIVWETGQMQTEEAMRDLMKVADANNDQHMTVEEIIDAQGKDEGNANFYFHDWITHYEL